VVGATQPAGRDHLVDARTASFGVAGYRFAYLAIAAAIVVSTAFAPVNSAALALAHFLGGHILNDRAIPMRLGSETFTAPGSYSGGIGWLGAVANELLARAGYGAALFATMLAALVAFAFVELRARRLGGRWLALGAVVLARAEIGLDHLADEIGVGRCRPVINCHDRPLYRRRSLTPAESRRRVKRRRDRELAGSAAGLDALTEPAGYGPAARKACWRFRP